MTLSDGARIHSDLASAALERAERIPQTAPGKTRMVVAEAL